MIQFPSLGSMSFSLAHQGLLFHSVHLFPLSNMKRISALCQLGKLSMGKVLNVIQNKNRAGKAGEQWIKQKVDMSFSFLT